MGWWSARSPNYIRWVAPDPRLRRAFVAARGHQEETVGCRKSREPESCSHQVHHVEPTPHMTPTLLDRYPASPFFLHHPVGSRVASRSIIRIAAKCAPSRLDKSCASQLRPSPNSLSRDFSDCIPLRWVTERARSMGDRGTSFAGEWCRIVQSLAPAKPTAALVGTEPAIDDEDRARRPTGLVRG
jgi:hypothetical protein